MTSESLIPPGPRRTFGRQSRSGRFWTTSLAPLLDVLFILLIFLLVTANFDSRQILEVELPAVTTATDAPSRQKELRRVITLFADGSLRFNDKPTTRAELFRYLEAQPQGERLLSVTIQADTATPLGTGLSLLDALRRLGYLSCAFEVRPPAEPPTTLRAERARR